ncbi:MAG: VOC family protein [Caldilineaceae bacterium]
MNPETTGLPSMFKRMDHIGVIVSSLDETLKTYCDQVGFALLERI